MTWLLVALSAYLFLAVANLIDKFLVDNVLPSSKTYAFIACVLGLLVLVLAPWFLHWPGWWWLLVNLVVGFSFAIALWLLYEALKQGEAARILVFIGGFTPIFTIFFSLIFLLESFSAKQWFGIVFLLVGTLVMAFIPEPRSFISRLLKRIGFGKKPNKKVYLIALGSALFYSVYYLLSKYTYNHQEFFSAFIWNRIGAALFVLFFLFSKKERENVRSVFKTKSPQAKPALVIANQALGSSGFILQNYAISLGSVALINALQGFQYAFLLVLSSVLGFFLPKYFPGKSNNKVRLQKVLAVILVGLGLAFIAI